jgi:predicted HTH transcriptional regulator
MTYKDVNKLIEEGEGFDIEFKRKVSTPEKIARTLTALANTKGGHILFGVDDDGSIVGVESEKSEVDLIQQAGTLFCVPEIHPEIEIVPFDGSDVIVAYVHESDEKPHLFTGSPNGDAQNGDNTRVYIRVNDTSVMASKEVVKILKSERPDAKPIKIEIGENEKRLFKFLEEHKRITVPEFARLVNISERRASRTLVLLVQAGVVRIHTLEKRDFFTLAYNMAA